MSTSAIDKTADLPASSPSARRLPRFWPYLAAVLLPLAVLFWVTDLWKANLNVLFTYYLGGDLLENAALTKGLLEHGSALVNPSLGAPFGLERYDFPRSEALHFFLLRVLDFFTRNAASAINLLYVLSYPLTALSALWVFRQFKISNVPAVSCALFYTFLFYHFARGLSHFSLACYFMVPLVLWVALTLETSDPNEGNFKRLLASRWFFTRLTVCVAIASYGFYYSFFGMFFIAAGGVFALIYRRTGFSVSLALVTAMLGTSFLNVVPNIFFWAKEGKNQIALVRTPIAAEFYGLKIVYLLFPNPNHHLHWLGAFTVRYLEQSGLNENFYAGLGVIGSLGFLLLLTKSFFPRRNSLPAHIFQRLATFNLAGLLLATVGGFGTVLAFLGLEQIRAYNRISVFLAFLAFLAIALIWQRIEESVPRTLRPIFIAVSVIVTVFGLWDEIPAGVAPDYALSMAQSTGDSAFVAKLESSLPQGSMIFQLPYVPFPESAPIVQLRDYAHFRPYLFSKNLRWSYGAMKGRSGAAWIENTSRLSPPEMLKAVTGTGYAGIYIDRFGYTDQAVALEAQISSLLGTPPMVSADNRLCFFSLHRK